jgi:hypothetical protein
MEFHQGDCIRLAAPPSADTSGSPVDNQLYQVISIDPDGGRCWLRRWPMAPKGSPVFELDLHYLQASTAPSRVGATWGT